MTKHFKVTKKPPSPAQQFAFFRGEVAKGMQPIADRQVERHKAIPSNRHGRFKFEGETVIKETHILTRVALENEGESLGRYGGTVGALWDWLNRGTPAHAILPRFKQTLSFTAGGVRVFVRRVLRHPGTKPQRNTERINQSLEPFRKQTADKGFKSAWKKLEQFNKRKR